jgi:hypothetical protein
MIQSAIKPIRKFLLVKSFYAIHKLQISLFLVLLLVSTSIAFSEPTISILWEKEIKELDRGIIPYTLQIHDENIVRVVGVSCTPRTKETPKAKDPNLFEYRLNLNDNISQMKTILSMNEEDITVTLPEGDVKDSRLIDDTIVIIRGQYKSHNFQELSIGRDWQVKTRDIPGLTRLSVSTHGACRNLTGDVFLCGNSGYVRKVSSDGKVAWDTNYKSDKGEDGTLSVAFSESEKMLVAFGFSFEPDTKFTTKNSSMWLANLDSDGNFKAKTEFEGIVNFGKFPSFCLSTSDHPMVIYDNNTKTASNPMTGYYTIFVSKFSKDLTQKTWTTQIFDAKDLMVSRLSLTPFGEEYTLAVINSMAQQARKSHFYILDKNGVIVNQAVFEDVIGSGYLVTVMNDKIFYVTDGRRFENGKMTEFGRLICFKINP